MDDKSREFLAATGGDAREAQTQPPKTEERAAFEAWYANRHPKPVHENATWAHASKVDDWEVWQARAALSSRPVQGGEITEAEIDRIAALTEKGMEEGLRGFMRTWGWQQFARTLVENLAPYGLRLSSAPAQEPMTDEQAEQIRLEVGFAGGASRFVEFTRAIERHHGICKE